MKKRERSIVGVTLLCLTQVWMVSCAGGHVSGNGIFQDGHKELKESLVGSWRVIDPEAELVGEELYTFFTDKKKKRVRLKVEGKERVIERFNSIDGLSFSFEYQDDDGDFVYVAGQFKSAARESLMLMREPSNALKASLGSVLLQKRETEVKTVVAENGKN